MKRNASHDPGYIIDSCGWIEYFSGGKKADKYAKYIENATPDTCYTPTTVIYEVFKKFAAAYSDEETLKAVGHIQSATKVIDFDDYLAVSAAEESIAEKLPMADAIILATARRKGAKVVTSDTHLNGKKDVIFV